MSPYLHDEINEFVEAKGRNGIVLILDQLIYKLQSLPETEEADNVLDVEIAQELFAITHRIQRRDERGYHRAYGIKAAA